jgi:hypothetical protein
MIYTATFQKKMLTNEIYTNSTNQCTIRNKKQDNNLHNL